MNFQPLPLPKPPTGLNKLEDFSTPPAPDATPSPNNTEVDTIFFNKEKVLGTIKSSKNTINIVLLLSAVILTAFIIFWVITNRFPISIAVLGGITIFVGVCVWIPLIKLTSQNLKRVAGPTPDVALKVTTTGLQTSIIQNIIPWEDIVTIIILDNDVHKQNMQQQLNQGGIKAAGVKRSLNAGATFYDIAVILNSQEEYRNKLNPGVDKKAVGWQRNQNSKEKLGELYIPFDEPYIHGQHREKFIQTLFNYAERNNTPITLIRSSEEGGTTFMIAKMMEHIEEAQK